MSSVKERSMKVMRVPCKLEPSLFSSQYRASFVIEERRISTICDSSLVSHGAIELAVIKECDDGSVIVSVPGELVRGWRVVRTSRTVAERYNVESDESKSFHPEIGWHSSSAVIMTRRTSCASSMLDFLRRLNVRFLRHFRGSNIFARP